MINCTRCWPQRRFISLHCTPCPCYYLFRTEYYAPKRDRLVAIFFFSHRGSIRYAAKYRRTDSSRVVEGKIKREFKCKFLACHKHPMFCKLWKNASRAGSRKWKICYQKRCTLKISIERWLKMCNIIKNIICCSNMFTQFAKRVKNDTMSCDHTEKSN